MTDRTTTERMRLAGATVLQRTLRGGLFGGSVRKFHVGEVAVQQMMDEIYVAMTKAAGGDGETANPTATKES